MFYVSMIIAICAIWLSFAGTGFRFKRVMIWSSRERLFRIGRFLWHRGRPGCPGGGFSAKFSVAMTPRLFAWEKGWHSLALTLFGVRAHYQRSYGGWIVAMLLVAMAASQSHAGPLSNFRARVSTRLHREPTQVIEQSKNRMNCRRERSLLKRGSAATSTPPSAQPSASPKSEAATAPTAPPEEKN